MTYWHGGPPIRGDMLLPPTDTGYSRSGNDEPYVHVTPTRDLAATYAATCRGWLYQVEPIGPLTQDPDSILPDGESLRCPQARILRRYRLPRHEYDLRTDAVHRQSRQR